MQSSWTRWCRLHLDARTERGTPERMTQREHVHAEVYAQIKDEVREELWASLQAEVREEFAREEIEAARRIAKEACQRHREAARPHDVERVQFAAKARLMGKQRDVAQAQFQAVEKDLVTARKELERERADADARALLLRQARAASEPHLAHMSSLMKRYADNGPEMTRQRQSDRPWRRHSRSTAN
ncbi:hypothetical protein [Palleronia sp.]|uniref:hypothetical protein n=1 Tax=Palleronia sp. TaxID=1940284 RepID=UPI0035C87B5A